MEHWHLLQTKPNKERQVAVLLHQRGLEVYLPLVWANRTKPRSAREKPYFPGYLFARLDLQGIAPSILQWSPGLKGIVEFAREPATVSDAFIGELKQRLSSIRTVGGMAFENSPHSVLVPITNGPFAGFEGLFSSSLTAPDRARILVACIEHEYWTVRSRLKPSVSSDPCPAPTSPSSVLPERRHSQQ